jgi:predicted AlkP superfamily phosphohydrolase/phosphomutase
VTNGDGPEEGVISPEEYESFRKRLADETEAIPGHLGRPIGTRVLKPEDLYRQVSGIAPDLFAYFGQLRRHSVGTVGLGTIPTFDNDTGPDQANHAEEGLFILSGPGVAAGRRWDGGQLMGIAPTLLRLCGMDVPADMQGRAFPAEVIGTAGGRPEPAGRVEEHPFVVPGSLAR